MRAHLGWCFCWCSWLPRDLSLRCSLCALCPSVLNHSGKTETQRTLREYTEAQRRCARISFCSVIEQQEVRSTRPDDDEAALSLASNARLVSGSKRFAVDFQLPQSQKCRRGSLIELVLMASPREQRRVNRCVLMNLQCSRSSFHSHPPAPRWQQFSRAITERKLFCSHDGGKWSTAGVTQSCNRWTGSLSEWLNSECRTPVPALIRWISPGRITPVLPYCLVFERTLDDIGHDFHLRWPWRGSRPGATTSSLKTRNGQNHVAGS